MSKYLRIFEAEETAAEQPTDGRNFGKYTQAVEKMLQDGDLDRSAITTAKEDDLYGIHVNTKDQTWWFLDEGEANDAFHDAKMESIEQSGLGGFTAKYQKEITKKFVKKEWFSKTVKRNVKSLLHNLKDQPSDSKQYKTRLEQKMAEDGATTPEELYQILLRKAGNPIDYFRDQFGENDLTNVIEEHELVDWDLVIQDVRENNGRGDALSSYDGKEHEFENVFYYRVR